MMMRKVVWPDGPFTRADLRELNNPDAALKRGLRAGTIPPILRGVFVRMDVADTTEMRAQAVAKVVRPHHVVTDRTAAWLHGIDVHVNAERDCVPRVETCALRGHEPTAITGIDARSRDLRPEDVEGTLRRGHPGSANLRAALDAHAPGRGEMKSRLERRFRDLLIRHDIELPERNQPVGPWTVDCLWRQRRVTVELDGRQHQRPHQADADDDRDLWLRRHGYIARRYGKRQNDEEPDDVIADLLNAFAEALALGYAAAGVPLRLL